MQVKTKRFKDVHFSFQQLGVKTRLNKSMCGILSYISKQGLLKRFYIKLKFRFSNVLYQNLGNCIHKFLQAVFSKPVGVENFWVELSRKKNLKSEPRKNGFQRDFFETLTMFFFFWGYFFP